jgi:hypothetical protein
MTEEPHMHFTFTVEVEVEREQGKFASRDEISEAIAEALGDARLDSFEGENGGEYTVTDWSVEEAS